MVGWKGQENRDLLFAATISSAQRELLRRHTEQLVRKKKKKHKRFLKEISHAVEITVESLFCGEGKWWPGGICNCFETTTHEE